MRPRVSSSCTITHKWYYYKIQKRNSAPGAVIGVNVLDVAVCMDQSKG